MKIKSVSLDIVAGITSRLPETGVPEFAFSGRSNVGKSSLLNALILRKNYARTSAQPGKTQTINFYRVNGVFFLVDLPGYGYARVSRETREKWGRMIDRYLKGSKTLRQVFLLVDMRHEPTADDCAMIERIRQAGFTPAVIATKADKLSRNEQHKMLPVIRKKLQMKAEEVLIPFSAQTKAGREEILEKIAAFLPAEDTEAPAPSAESGEAPESP